MSRHHTAITIHDDRAYIEVDGVPLRGIRGFTVESEAGGRPRLVVDFALTEATIDGEMVVGVPEATRSGLMALGWTPPDAPEG